MFRYFHWVHKTVNWVTQEILDILKSNIQTRKVAALHCYNTKVYLYYNIIILIITIIIILLHYIYKHKLSSPTTTKSEQPCPQYFDICIAWPLKKIKILLGSPSKKYCLFQESVFSKVVSFSSLNRKASHLGTYVRSDDFRDDKKYP